MATINQFTQAQAKILVPGSITRTNFTFVTGNSIGGITFGWTATADRILVIAAFKQEGQPIATTPTGYTRFAEVSRGGVSAAIVVIAKVSDGTENSATGFAWTGGDAPEGYAVFEYQGVVWAPAISSGVPSGSYIGTSITIPNDTAGVVLSMYFVAPQTGTGTPGSGWTEMVDSLTNGNFPQIYIEEKMFTAGTGAITPSFTNSTSSDYPGTVSLALSGGSGTYNQYAQAQTTVVGIGNQFTQAQGSIFFSGGFSQAQAAIKFVRTNFWQAQAHIKRTNRNFTQTQASIRFPGGFFQAQAKIIYRQTPVMQAMAYLSNRKWIFQAQATIIVRGKQSMQAMASITNRKKSWQAQAYILSDRYLIKYNNYQLPGYAQQEVIDSSINLATAGTPFGDTGFSAYTGLENKLLSLTILVLGNTYLECKNQIELAATELRSQPKTFAPLYVQNYSKHYDAWVRTIKFDADTGTNRSATYAIDFVCKPWLYSDIQTTISGLSLVETTGRDIYNGGWTPVNLRLSGSNITVSGYTATGDFTGFLSVSGGVTGLSVNTEAYTVEMAGLNRADLVRNDDFKMFVGPGVTYFQVTGATTCEISYHDRWYL